jgi:putative FmdB family regulatory protein
MPTYHYRCDACAHAFDAFQKFSDDPLRVCPECEGSVRRVIQPTPVVFKGSGWYITDSKAKTNGAAKDAVKDGADKAEGKAEGKTDGTVEGKAEAKSDAKPEPASKTKEAVAAKAD